MGESGVMDESGVIGKTGVNNGENFSAEVTRLVPILVLEWCKKLDMTFSPLAARLIM